MCWAPSDAFCYSIPRNCVRRRCFISFYVFFCFRYFWEVSCFWCNHFKKLPTLKINSEKPSFSLCFPSLSVATSLSLFRLFLVSPKFLSFYKQSRVPYMTEKLQAKPLTANLYVTKSLLQIFNEFLIFWDLHKRDLCIVSFPPLNSHLISIKLAFLYKLHLSLHFFGENFNCTWFLI